MFNHGIVQEVELPKKSKVKSNVDLAKLKDYHDKVGLQPIDCVTPMESFMENDFGWIRNDISAYMQCKDDGLRQSIEKNLDVVLKSSHGSDITVQDAFDAIIPKSVQTPAEIERFGRVVSEIYGKKLVASDVLPSREVKSEDVNDNEVVKTVENSPEV